MAAAATPRPGRPSSPRTWGMRRCPRRRWPPMRCSASASRCRQRRSPKNVLGHARRRKHCRVRAHDPVPLRPRWRSRTAFTAV